jgi:dimethylhistidine N-methyltransferase
MAKVIEASSDLETDHHHEKIEFIQDLAIGLAKSKKQIPSKYFYDEHGSELFNQITRHPDYYLTQCEVEILNLNKTQIANLFNSEPFNLVELGPGEGIKTQILIEEFLQKSLQFTYLPIDISKKYLKTLVDEFSAKLQYLKLLPLYSDYFHGLEWLRKHSKRTNLVLFLGSSIGNFTPMEVKDFLEHLCHSLNKNDYVLLGFDLHKDIQVLMRAYDDNDGITRNFNLNLLDRINRELQADFDIRKFKHYATYNVYNCAMESYLISQEPQTIAIEALGQSFTFDKIEPIHVEYSHKFSLKQINDLAENTGFEIIQTFSDSKKYFIDTLWRVK